MFGAGMGTGILVHEASHAGTALSLGMGIDKIGFTSVYINFKGLEREEINSKMRKVSLAGYLAQGLVSEFILQNKQWHTNDFSIGLMSLGVLNNLNNVYLYYYKKDKEIDLALYKKYGGNPLIPALIMVTHSTLVLYRMFSNTEMPNHFIGNTLGIQVKF